MKVVSGWDWCTGCGYRVERPGGPDFVPDPAGSRKPRPAGPSELVLTARLLPVWAWVLLAGLTVVCGASCAADLCLPLPSRERAVWSTAQFLLGLTGLLVAGLWVSQHLGLNKETISLVDLLLPDRLWPLAIKRLPATRWQVCTGAWSLTAMLCAAVWVGGWTYWLPTAKAPRPAAKGKGTFPAAKKEEDTDVPDPAATPKDDVNSSTVGDGPEAQGPKPPKEVTRCVIVGYTVEDGELTGLVTAKVSGSDLHYTGVVPLGKDSALKEDLLARFAALKAKTAVFPDLNVRAVWLQPELSCEVESTASGDPILKDPQFKGLILPKTPQPVRLDPPEDGKPSPPTTKPATTRTAPPKAPAPSTGKAPEKAPGQSK
jgi:hypothetical protein